MRTTLDLPDSTFRQLKSLAAERGVSVKYLLRVAVERELKAEQEPARGTRLKFPLLKSKEPGSLNLTNAAIEDLLA